MWRCLYAHIFLPETVDDDNIINDILFGLKRDFCFIIKSLFLISIFFTDCYVLLYNNRENVVFLCKNGELYEEKNKKIM